MAQIFSAEQLDNLNVKQMIFHLVGKEEGPDLFDEGVVPSQHQVVFRQLISSAARGKKFDWQETCTPRIGWKFHLRRKEATAAPTPKYMKLRQTWRSKEH
mgnify:CR=1 FL=1